MSYSIHKVVKSSGQTWALAGYGRNTMAEAKEALKRAKETEEQDPDYSYVIVKDLGEPKHTVRKGLFGY